MLFIVIWSLQILLFHRYIEWKYDFYPKYVVLIFTPNIIPFGTKKVVQSDSYIWNVKILWKVLVPKICLESGLINRIKIRDSKVTRNIRWNVSVEERFKSAYVIEFQLQMGDWILSNCLIGNQNVIMTVVAWLWTMCQ